MGTKVEPLAVTTMEAALIAGKGFEQPVVEQRGRQFVAISIKGPFRAEALGHTRDEAARNLVKVIVRK